jgi:CheY-like chemotaxis protein
MDGAVVPPVILVTDDDKFLLELHRRILKREGYADVICTPDAIEALRICQSQPVALVISDMMKPGINGLDLLRLLRTDPTTRHIRFMFVTACAAESDVATAFRMGADAYLTKPFRTDDLTRQVRKLLDAIH